MTAEERLIRIADRLETEDFPNKEELAALINGRTESLAQYVSAKASAARDEYYGKKVFVRGLVEFTNFCKNNCLYCGIRAGNAKAERYRLTEDEILECCDIGESLGFKTFVLQGGEDPFFTDDKICRTVEKIKSRHPDCAVTLSIGEKPRESYEKFFEAGADRYLLRHETANPEHYAFLHPAAMSFENRRRCLRDLKDIGFATGSGFMVGSPAQTAEHLAEDLLFLKELKPHMVGIGPFVPHKDTPFGTETAGTAELTLFMLALTRLILPNALIPATTALGTIAENGREMGILAGANVVMPNLSPASVRAKYTLYDNKIHTGAEAAESLDTLKKRIRAVGYEVVCDRGDPATEKQQTKG